MNRHRGQALVELAICVPVLAELALGGAAIARVADARGGLDAATQQAAAVAARAGDATSAQATANQAFQSALVGYPVSSPVLNLAVGGFGRSGTVSARATASVDISFVPLPGLPHSVGLTSIGLALIEPWRSR